MLHSQRSKFQLLDLEYIPVLKRVVIQAKHINFQTDIVDPFGQGLQLMNMATRLVLSYHFPTAAYGSYGSSTRSCINVQSLSSIVGLTTFAGLVYYQSSLACSCNFHATCKVKPHFDSKILYITHHLNYFCSKHSYSFSTYRKD